MTNVRVSLALVSVVSLALVAGCASLTGPSPQARSEAATRVLEAYDMPAMLGQVAPIINDSLKANLPPSVSDAEHERLTRAVADTYEAEALLDDMNERLRRRAKADERTGVLIEAKGKLDTSLARDMIALERKAATDEFVSGFKKFLDKPVEEEDKPRLEKARTLLERMRLVDLQVAFNIGMLRGMVTARNAAANPADQTSGDNTARMTEQTESSLRKRMNRQLPIMLFYAYRNVEDAKLDRYATLQASPPLAWLNETMPEVLTSVLRDATERLPENYAAQPSGET